MSGDFNKRHDQAALNMSRKLDVYLHSHKAGLLEQDNAANLRFTYNEDYLNSEAAKPISVLMPLTDDAYANTIAKPYFSGLLPDESARSRLASALGVSDTNAFGMLEISSMRSKNTANSL